MTTCLATPRWQGTGRRRSRERGGGSLRASRGRGGAGLGGRSRGPGHPTGRRSARCGALRSGAVRRVRLRSARLPAGRGDHMSSRPVGARSSPAAPRLLRAALTMSVCCCFFFRDYGSSRRKSGKGVSGVCRLPASCASPSCLAFLGCLSLRVPFPPTASLPVPAFAPFPAASPQAFPCGMRLAACGVLGVACKRLILPSGW